MIHRKAQSLANDLRGQSKVEYIDADIKKQVEAQEKQADAQKKMLEEQIRKMEAEQKK